MTQKLDNRLYELIPLEDTFIFADNKLAEWQIFTRNVCDFRF